jgi:uncharacterized membrane protein YuzA (DUF378 family)
MKLLSMLVRLLVVVGALNWGLWGFFQFDLVAFLFGGNSTMMARLVYALVGIAAVLSVKSIFKCNCSCHKGGGKCCM